MNNDEMMQWSRSIADACIKTTIKPDDVVAACEAFVRAQNGKQTNYEKYFGSLDKTAETLAAPKKMEDSFSCWACCEGALLVSLVPPSHVRTNGRTKAISNCYNAWLQDECI